MLLGEATFGIINRVFPGSQYMYLTMHLSCFELDDLQSIIATTTKILIDILLVVCGSKTLPNFKNFHELLLKIEINLEANKLI